MENNDKKACQVVSNELLDQITLGRLKKGDRLPTERQLSEDMDVSRSSVREALKSLETMGIIYSVQGSGSYITEAPEETINKPLCALFALGNGTLENIVQLRQVIETAACKDIILHSSDAHLRYLCSLADYDYCLHPASIQSILDSRFHCAIVNSSDNVLLKYIYNTLSSLMDIYRTEVLEETYRQDENALTKEGHMKICQALLDRDISAAEDAVSGHLELNDIYISKIAERRNEQ